MKFDASYHMYGSESDDILIRRTIFVGARFMILAASNNECLLLLPFGRLARGV